MSPVLRSFVRNLVVAQLERKGKDKATAEKLFDETICDTCLGGALTDVGLNEVPKAGIFPWIIANLPQIIKVVVEIVTLLLTLSAEPANA